MYLRCAAVDRPSGTRTPTLVPTIASSTETPEVWQLLSLMMSLRCYCMFINTDKVILKSRLSRCRLRGRLWLLLNVCVGRWKWRTSNCRSCAPCGLGSCRIIPPRFLAECGRRPLYQGSFVVLYFALFAFSGLYLVSSVFLICLLSILWRSSTCVTLYGLECADVSLSVYLSIYLWVMKLMDQFARNVISGHNSTVHETSLETANIYDWQDSVDLTLFLYSLLHLWFKECWRSKQSGLEHTHTKQSSVRAKCVIAWHSFVIRLWFWKFSFIFSCVSSTNTSSFMPAIILVCNFDGPSVSLSPSVYNAMCLCCV